jgi:ATP-dependent Clp protease adaptor protein ClpS
MVVSTETVVSPDVGTKEKVDPKSDLEPGYLVICWDDPVNLMDYVTHVFRTVFGWPKQKAEFHMLQVHRQGKSVLVVSYQRLLAEPWQQCQRLHAFLQIGVAKEDQPHYLKLLARPEADVSDLVDFGLGVIAARTTKGGDHRHDRGVIAPVRTYEAPIDRRLEDAGFTSIADVTLLMKETLVRVAEPALVPAGVR